MTEQATAPDASTDCRGSTEDDWAGLASALIQSRFSVAPRLLQAPGPTPAELQQMVEAAGTAPDHHDLRPWRLVCIADDQRDTLSDLFEACLREREPQPRADHLARARAKAHHAPTLLLAILRHEPADEDVPAPERAATLGAAMMNLMLVAHAMGYGAMLSGGRSLRSPRFAQAFGLAPGEQPLCFVSIGTPQEIQRRPRPSAHELLTQWQPATGRNADP